MRRSTLRTENPGVGGSIPSQPTIPFLSPVAISDLLREAIDHRYERAVKSKGLDVGAIMRRMFEEYPDPPDLPPRGYDVHDRSAARRAVLRRLKRKAR